LYGQDIAPLPPFQRPVPLHFRRNEIGRRALHR
jgi:hypothetical protein